MLPSVGDKLVLTADIYDDGADHHPPCYIGIAGDIVIVRKIHNGCGVYVSHEDVTDNSFLVYEHEYRLFSPTTG